MKKVIAVALVAVGMIFGANGVTAQSPENQFGVGGFVGTGLSAAQLQYAFTPAFHLGTGIGLTIQGGTSIIFAPYGKFILQGSKELKPFVMASLIINSMSSDALGSSTSTALRFGGGVEHFITPNMGVWFGLTILDLPLSPSGQDVGFGFLYPTLGAEWFF